MFCNLMEIEVKGQFLTCLTTERETMHYGKDMTDPCIMLHGSTHFLRLASLTCPNFVLDHGAMITKSHIGFEAMWLISSHLIRNANIRLMKFGETKSKISARFQPSHIHIHISYNGSFCLLGNGIVMFLLYIKTSRMFSTVIATNYLRGKISFFFFNCLRDVHVNIGF